MMKRVDLSVAPFALQVSGSGAQGGDGGDDDDVEAKSGEKGSQSPSPASDSARNGVRYRECMKNHAASIGGHANDGCGEFMPGGDQGGSTLKCAACGCHRNFHRKDVAAPAASGGGCLDHYFLQPPPPVGWDQRRVFERFPYLSALPMPPPPALIAAPPPHLYGGGGTFGAVESRDQDRRSETPDGREDHHHHHHHQMVVGLLKNSNSNKRFRTKFTQEQKEKMMDFAEKLGWRIQRHDDMALNEFCSEIGVKRRVLKVWMHNNKSALRKRDNAEAAAAAAASDAGPTDHEDNAPAEAATESLGGS